MKVHFGCLGDSKASHDVRIPAAILLERAVYPQTWAVFPPPIFLAYDGTALVGFQQTLVVYVFSETEAVWGELLIGCVPELTEPVLGFPVDALADERLTVGEAGGFIKGLQGDAPAAQTDQTYNDITVFNLARNWEGGSKDYDGSNMWGAVGSCADRESFLQYCKKWGIK